jgi:predicted GNAT family acetyltransferase
VSTSDSTNTSDNQNAGDSGKTTVLVEDNPAESRFEARTSTGELAGQAKYRVESGPDSGSTVVFTHTIVEDAFEGQGVGSRLARAALDTVRDRGQRVKPECSFIRSYIERHEEYQNLVS